MNVAAIDIIALVLVTLSVLHGLIRGFARQALGIGGWVIALLLTCRYYTNLIPWTRSFIHDHTVADITAFILLMLVLLVVASFASSLIVRVIHQSALQGLDHTLGALFGLARGVLLVLLLFVSAQWLLPPEDIHDIENKGKFTPYIRMGVAYIQPFMPDFTTKGVAPDRTAGHDATL
nr:CvpA family protein [Acetobacter thailandicus]